MISTPGLIRVEDVTGKTYEFYVHLSAMEWSNKEAIKTAAQVILRMKYRNENDITNVERV